MEYLLTLKIVLLPLPVLLSAYFAGSEIALMSLSGTTLSQLKSRYPRLRTLFEFWENYPDRVLACIILGNTLGTVLSGVLAASIGKDCARIWGLPNRGPILVFSLVVTALVLIFGEILPKISGRLYSETLSRYGIVPLVPLTKIIYPLVQILVRLARIFIRVLGKETQKEIPMLTAAELKGMLETDSAPEPGKVRPHHILKNILEFGQLRVKSVQKPIEKVVAIDIQKSTREVIIILAQSPYSRIVAYKNSLDNIVGIIYAKDLLYAWRTEGLILIPDLLRDAYFVSEIAPVSELLREFKKGRHHMAVVVNESKNVTGIITIEDILEEIVGEVYDESKLETRQ